MPPTPTSIALEPGHIHTRFKGLRHWLAVVPFLAACAHITPQEPVQVDKPVLAQKAPVRTDGIVGSVDQDGLSVVVTASHSCRIREDRVVRRTTTIEHKNATATNSWLTLGAGLAVLGAGVVVLADASRVAPNDTTGRTYNSTGPNGARTWSYGLMAGGGLLVTIPVVDAIRASETTVREQEVRIEGEPAGDVIPCPDAPASAAPVVLVFDQVKAPLGTTDRKGSLAVNLDDVIDREVVIGKPGKAEILVGDTVLGTVLTKPLVAVREARAWAKLPRGKCRNPTTPTDCDLVVEFLKTYPASPHAGEGRQLVQEGKTKVEAILERQAWEAISLPTCTNPKLTTTAEIETACAPVEAYLGRFPDGPHASEAKKAVSVGQQRAADIQARLEKQIRDKEIQVRRAEREAQEREQQGERRRCEGQCRMICSSRNFRDPAACFQGCVAKECGQ
jgi:hypothetical protein